MDQWGEQILEIQEQKQKRLTAKIAKNCRKVREENL